MIDGFNILNLKVDKDSLLNNKLLNFPLSVTEDTGEVNNSNRRSNYKNLLFTITPQNIIKLKGSFHYFFNNGKHNFNDFTFSDFLNVVIELYNKFNINPKITNLNGFEFGVNIKTPYNPDVFLNSLISHNTKTFNKFKSKDENYLQFRHQQYNIKIYNKGLQNKLKDNILRFEIKVTKMEYLKKYNITTLWDLLNIDNWKIFHSVLIRIFNELIYYDNTIELDKLKSNEKNLLEKGNNPIFWNNLKESKKQNWNKTKHKFKKLVNKYGKNEFYKLEYNINNKFKELSKISINTFQIYNNFDKELSSEKVHVLTDLKKYKNNILNNTSKTSDLISLSDNFDNKKNTHIDFLNNMLFKLENNKEILITNLKYTMLKINKFFNINKFKYNYLLNNKKFKISEKTLLIKCKKLKLKIQLTRVLQ